MSPRAAKAGPLHSVPARAARAPHSCQNLTLRGYAAGETRAAQRANLDLAELRFFREYVNPPEAPASTNDLPDMEGAGAVARLRVAAATDPVLNPTLRGYAAGETRAAQRANLDALIGAWADTSLMKGSREAAADLAPTVVVQWQFAGVATHYVLDVLQVFSDAQTAPGSYRLSPATFEQNQTAEYGAWVRKLELLEKFNGQSFVNPILFQTAIQEAHREKLIEYNGNLESALSSVAYINVPVSARGEAWV